MFFAFKRVWGGLIRRGTERRVATVATLLILSWKLAPHYKRNATRSRVDQRFLIIEDALGTGGVGWADPHAKGITALSSKQRSFLRSAVRNAHTF